MNATLELADCSIRAITAAGLGDRELCCRIAFLCAVLTASRGAATEGIDAERLRLVAELSWVRRSTGLGAAGAATGVGVVSLYEFRVLRPAVHVACGFEITDTNSAGFRAVHIFPKRDTMPRTGHEGRSPSRILCAVDPSGTLPRRAARASKHRTTGHHLPAEPPPGGTWPVDRRRGRLLNSSSEFEVEVCCSRTAKQRRGSHDRCRRSHSSGRQNQNLTPDKASV